MTVMTKTKTMCW